MTTIIGTVYFWKISKNWIGVGIMACSMGVLAMLGAIFIIPESPKFLISKKHFDRARNSINTIARLNGTYRRFNGLFEQE